MMNMFTFIRFHAKSGEQEDVAAALSAVVSLTRDEPGCLRINFFQSTRDTQLFYIHAHWEDNAAFSNHCRLAHTVEFISRVSPLIDHPIEVHRTSLML